MKVAWSNIINLHYLYRNDSSFLKINIILGKIRTWHMKTFSATAVQFHRNQKPSCIRTVNTKCDNWSVLTPLKIYCVHQEKSRLNGHIFICQCDMPLRMARKTSELNIKKRALNVHTHFLTYGRKYVFLKYFQQEWINFAFFCLLFQIDKKWWFLYQLVMKL